MSANGDDEARCYKKCVPLNRQTTLAYFVSPMLSRSIFKILRITEAYDDYIFVAHMTN